MPPKLKKYFDAKIHVKWGFSKEHDRYVSHLQVRGSTIDFHPNAEDANWLSCMEEAVDRVEKQLKKHKEKMKDHHK